MRFFSLAPFFFSMQSARALTPACSPTPFHHHYAPLREYVELMCPSSSGIDSDRNEETDIMIVPLPEAEATNLPTSKPTSAIAVEITPTNTSAPTLTRALSHTYPSTHTRKTATKTALASADDVDLGDSADSLV